MRLILAAVLAAPAAAQGLCCMPRAVALAMLTERLSEMRRGIGLAGPRQVIEVFASPAGTWTALATDPTGRACIVASGTGWEDLRAPEGEPA